MRFIQTLVNSIIIFCLLIIIGALLSLFVPALAKSLNNAEEMKKDERSREILKQIRGDV